MILIGTASRCSRYRCRCRRFTFPFTADMAVELPVLLCELVVMWWVAACDPECHQYHVTLGT